MRDLPIEMKIGLREFGMQEARLSQFGLRSRIMRDMRICPRQFERLYQCLAKAYDSEVPAPDEITSPDGGNDCLFITLGSLIPFFDRFIEGPDVMLGALDRHLRG